MKCITCKECLDKNICARLNGFFKAPEKLIAYNFKICEKFPSVLNKVKENSELPTEYCGNSSKFGNKNIKW